MKKRRIWAGLLLLAAVFLAGCSASDEKPEPELPPEPEEGVLIYAALNPVTPYLSQNIKTYNNVHPDTPINIRPQVFQIPSLNQLAVGHIKNVRGVRIKRRFMPECFREPSTI